MQTAARCVLLLIAMLVIAACGQSTAVYPTADEAKSAVTDAVQLAQRGRFDELCELGGGNCETILEEAGRLEVPPEPPALIIGNSIPTTTDGTRERTGGQVIVACGTRKDGTEYRTEMLVFFDNDHKLRIIEPVFWSGMTVGNSNTTAVGPPPPCP